VWSESMFRRRISPPSSGVSRERKHNEGDKYSSIEFYKWHAISLPAQRLISFEETLILHGVSYLRSVIRVPNI
jgi:hypothetical protein